MAPGQLTQDFGPTTNPGQSLQGSGFSIPPTSQRERESLKRKLAKRHPLNSFVITRADDPRMQIFNEIFFQNVSEVSKKGRELTSVEKRKAEQDARALIAEEGQSIFVAIEKVPVISANEKGKTRVKFVERPIGYVGFRVAMGEGMALSDAVFIAERVFLSEGRRDLKLAPRLLLRALGRAYDKWPTLARMVVRDPYGFKFMKGTVEHMRKKDWVGGVKYLTDRNAISAELNLNALDEELSVIRAYDQYTKSKKWQKPAERIRLALTRRRYNRARALREKRKELMKETYKRPDYKGRPLPKRRYKR
jgi:hypothetical protein